VQAATSPPAPPAPTPVSPAPVRRYLVALDASHGGDERGAALADNLPEKDVTLALARRIRGQLENRGISTLMLRDGDATLSADQRASSANSAHVSVYLAIHAGTDGIGVRICTAALASQTDTRGPFLSWNTAQAAYISASQAVANNLEAQLSRSLPARLLSAPLRPLNNVIAPAVAIEIAPRQPGNVADLNAPDYQQSIAAALATAIANARDGAGGGH
jgi:N-acetylmuramoyl-L-alanine amidase